MNNFDVAVQVLVEIKATTELLPVHFAIAYSYLKVSRRLVGLLINFHAPTLKDGIHRLVWFGGNR